MIILKHILGTSMVRTGI